MLLQCCCVTEVPKRNFSFPAHPTSFLMDWWFFSNQIQFSKTTRKDPKCKSAESNDLKLAKLLTMLFKVDIYLTVD